MHFVALLPLNVFVPHAVVRGEDRLLECRGIHFAERLDRNADVHAGSL
jgi:hypothetical protein